MEASFKSNTQIKFFHSLTTDEAIVRANANTVARALSRLSGPWMIQNTGDNTFVAYCVCNSANAIVIPSMPGVDWTRVVNGQKTVYNSDAMLRSY